MEPTIRPKVTPKDFFLWLGAMAALYVSATSLILLVHKYIEVWFPDVAQAYYGDPYSGTIRFSIASLVVLFPLFVWLMRLVHTDIRRNPEKRDLWVRRWMVYITLFVAGATIAGDLIAVIYTFLEGELTTRFLLKALTILVVLGGGFWYYLQELKGAWETNESLSKIIGAGVGAVVLIAVVSGFFIIGSPQDARLVKIDQQRVNDLQNIQWQIVNYWQLKESIPTSLTELQDPISGFVVPVDPETGLAYAYTATGATSFELCATFGKESLPTDPSMTRPIAVPIKGMPGEVGIDLNAEPWTHGVGEVCFDRTIDPQRYPPYNK